jgi:hypothetical protein
VQLANLSVSSQENQLIGSGSVRVLLPASGPAALHKTTPVLVEGAQLGTQHSFTVEEVIAFSEYINEVLANDPDLKGVLPIKSPDQFFRIASEGLLFWYCFFSSHF